MEAKQYSMPFRSGYLGAPPDRQMEEIFVIPWLEGDGGLPKSYSVHGYTAGAKAFVKEHAPQGLHMTEGLGNFSHRYHLFCGPYAQGNAVARAANKNPAGVDCEGVAVVDLFAYHSTYRTIRDRLDNEQLKNKKSGILITTDRRDPMRVMAQEIEDMLLWQEFIHDDGATARPKVVVFDPQRKPKSLPLPYVPA